ncbi:hypothetical protein NLJ89_g8348 [Agrocybe chaxingu]|uniref:Cytochrome P450 monooxygenase pc-3 n=1 Tax=Agrocybe chaxingu TaxID=84603 RepID=A0A9W8MS86_9AGAR|nr:hypothetical protein NLJ89_g8348 [Agrocybe chaxingu]
MNLPPGPTYLLRLFPSYAIPSTLVYFSLRNLANWATFSISSWLLVFVSFLARPLFFFAQVQYANLINKREAAKMGAVLAPTVKASGLQTIKIMVETLREGYPGEDFRRWAEDYGHTYQLNLLKDTALFTDDPEAVKAILATQFDAFEKGPIFQDQFHSLLGTGVFNTDGEMWKFHRSITRPFFSRERISDFDIYARNSDLSLKQARQRLHEGYSINFQDLVSRFTLDSATEFLFGHNVSSLSAGLPYPPSSSHLTPASFHSHPATIFATASTESSLLASLRTGRGPEWSLFEFWQDRIQPLREIIDNFTEPVIKEAIDRARVQDKGARRGEEGTLLEYMLQHTQDPQILKDEVVNLLVAGRDTTMALLTFSMYLMIQHPHVEHRLRQEIYDVVGPSGRPTYDHMRQMRFVRAFLNEVLRLYPSIPLNVRRSVRPVVLPTSDPERKHIYVPKDTVCTFSVFNMHRRTDLWGPDAEKFDPDRFLDERLHKYLTPNPFIFLPFNAGPRICIGQQFAYHEATFYLVRLLQQFTGFEMDREINQAPPAKWASTEDRRKDEQVHPVTHLTLSIVGGFWMRMRELNV